jgi:hypothetical protein
MMQYSTDANPVLVGVNQVIKDVLPTGVEVEMQTVSTISNMTSTVNL